MYMLWLAARVVDLPVAVFQRGCAQTQGLVIVAGQPSRVLAADRHAVQCGIQAGQKLSAAYALLPQLVACERNIELETQALQHVAIALYQYSAKVAIAAADTVVAEIGASLKLFGGLEALLSLLHAQLRELGYPILLCVTPSMTGACILSRDQARTAEVFVHADAFAWRFKSLPLTVLEPSSATLNALTELGIETIADAQRLPRAEFCRRFGTHIWQQIDRALGHVPDVCELFQPPQQFNSAIVLPSPVAEAEALLFAAHKLIQSLCAYLRSRGLGVTQLRYELQPERGAAQSLSFTLTRATRDAKHLLSLLRERLGRTQLAQPVGKLTLCADETCELFAETAPLFQSRQPRAAENSALIDRLRARLGERAVTGIDLRADHRPERAMKSVALNTARQTMRIQPSARPFWLVHPPRALRAVDTLPYMDGPLTLLLGPERIESGWWDGHDVQRDYYIAASQHGARFWVFKTKLRPNEWFLHGVFA